MLPQYDNRPTRKRLPHIAPAGVSQYTVGAPYFITICANRRHYGIIDPAGRAVPNTPGQPHPAGRVVPNTPGQPHLVGRVVPNAPVGGLGTSRPANTQRPLIAGDIAAKLLRSLDHYRTKGVLFPRIALVMPDHFHFMATFSQSVDMAQLIRNWKRWTARETGIVWQDGFFDHRLRNNAETTEKFDYIAMNPVRKGLCDSPDAWPFRKIWE